MEEAIIYGVKTDRGFNYIGKTIKSIKGNRDLRKSDVGARYKNNDIKNFLIENPDVNMVVLKTIALQDWYDEKLLEVVDKHKDQHPLLNSQWMLDGKRGFWEGKERDVNTLKQLSESKYKRVVQYDILGYLVKVWESGKEVATHVFKDYRIKNGSGCTRLYSMLTSNNIKTRFRYGSYWLKEEELIENFGGIPNRINIGLIIENQKKEKREKSKYRRPSTYRRYTIIYTDKRGNEIRYSNIFEAGLALKISPTSVGRICRGVIKSKSYTLRYGEKELQPIDIVKPKYTVKPINRKRK
jgi:hypothetical protein